MLATKLNEQPDVTISIKESIKALLTIPKTMEDITSIIDVVNHREKVYPKISLVNMDKQLTKARFHVNKEELDYV